MLNTIVYSRKSRGSQEELQNQIDICISYCKQKGYEVSEIFSEIESSQNFSREQYCKMIDYIKEHENTRVVCVDLSRLNRNVVSQIRFNELLIKCNSIIETVNNGIIKLDSPENKMMANIMSNFDEYYYAQTKQKMHNGMVEARKKGVRFGSVPYGYDIKDKVLIVDPEKADVVKRIFKMVSEGYGTQEVSKILTDEGIKNNKGNFFTSRAIRNIVTNEIYTGRKGESICPVIIDKELFLKANNQIKDIQKSKRKSYALSNKIVCSHCGSFLIIGSKKERGHSIVYNCRTSNMGRKNVKNIPCNNMCCNLDIINNLVISDCHSHIEIELQKIYEKLTEDRLILSSHSEGLQDLQNEIADNKEKLQRLNTLFVMGNISEEELKEMSQSIKDIITLKELELQKVEGYSLSTVIEELQNKATKLEELKASNNIDDLVKMVDKVEYYKDKSGIKIKTVFREA